ncbi:Hypothetical predicted protein [Paramuricea clavata]|uniref:Reverse transcriptase domain-containing protein n=1 Tax=Paramuricea clavata TaxID=317549 RepID=A0A7D9DBV0_PARCT|nr:Hypothetical predicted protein [Paramuricea clavata]
MWKSEFVRLAALPTSTSFLIASELTIISDRLCVLWTSTRDIILRKSNFPCKHRYGLKFDMKHLVFLIFLAGDIATNPGPTMTTQSGHLTDIQSTRIPQRPPTYGDNSLIPNPGPSITPNQYPRREKVDGKFLAKCLVVNARSLLSVNKKDELFNVYFSSVLNGNDNPIDSITPPSTTGCESTLSELNLCLDDVLIVLLNLDTNKATGPDGIPPRVLKETAHQIAPSLCSLFNRSLNSGSLPEEWKLANIIPVFKNGDKTHVENYRPISLLCIVSKVLERCVLSKLRDHLLELINTSQHGFIPGRSCTTQLVEVLNSLGSLLDSGKQTDVIFKDMSKAFDKVSHAALIAKLERYNISGSLLDWFSSYLYNRRQRGRYYSWCNFF